MVAMLSTLFRRNTVDVDAWEQLWLPGEWPALEPEPVEAIEVAKKRASEIAAIRWANPPLVFDDPEPEIKRPKTRGDCVDGPRPCPWVACRHHLYLEVYASKDKDGKDTEAIRLHFPDIEPDEMIESCALDVADRGGLSLVKLRPLMNITMERIRQLEIRALKKLKAAGLDLIRPARPDVDNE